MPRTTAAALAVSTLEQLGVKYTFGIPGVHNTELYDELDQSDSITPILVTSEFCGGFMADAISRTTDSVGALVLVPAAGLTHAASGIAEAYLDGIPMLVITGGIRNDTGRAYQLHDIDQLEIAKGFTKAAFRVERTEQVPSTLLEAHRLATEGTPGPVLVEIPMNLQMLPQSVTSESLSPTPPTSTRSELNIGELRRAADALSTAKKPVIFAGWGARHATEALVKLAEQLQAPVATSLQGLSVMPHNHPLHVGFGFGPAAVPAARKAFDDHDVMLAVGVRFAEIATGSYSIDPPEGLIHVDINPDVFDANYPATQCITGDGAQVIEALADLVKPREDDPDLRRAIADDKSSYHADFAKKSTQGRVNPARLFAELRAQLKDDVIVTVDDGNHTYLTAELWEHREPGMVISPTDFNAMGYAVPAAVAAAAAHPERQVMALVGDGCIRMTGIELTTASALGFAPLVVVFNDGELAQIAQAQTLPYNKKTCTVMPHFALHGLAIATGAEYFNVDNDDALAEIIGQALETTATGRPVVVDVRVDYSQRTAFTKGIIASNFKRFPIRDKARLATRAISRRVPRSAGNS